MMFKWMGFTLNIHSVPYNRLKCCSLRLKVKYTKGAGAAN